MKCTVLAVAVIAAEAQRPGKSCDLQAVFADMHDGDEKEVTIKGSAMTIKPYGGDEEWVVNTEIDCKALEAVVDFNVPGKKDHPPVPITATLFTSFSAKSYKSTFVYTDPSKTLVDDPTFPLNQWVAEVVDGEAEPGTGEKICPETLHSIFADMHDGDKKEVTIDDEAMTIKPSGSDQEWTVKATIDRKSCSASVDFNVPGKPDFPPVPLTATYWLEFAGKTVQKQKSFEFTDPSGTLAAADFPLNRWIEISEVSEQHV